MNPEPGVTPDFIYIADQAIPDDLCDELMTSFEAYPEKRQGGTGSGIDPMQKRSLDITIDGIEAFRESGQRFVNILLRHFAAYFMQYPFFGAVSPVLKNKATGTDTMVTMENRDQINDELMRMIVPSYFRLAPLNVLKYKAGEGAYPRWHAEVFPDPECESLHRVLFFVAYLNDVVTGGETELFFYGARVPPRKGRLLIAPASFTHTHRGNMPLSGDKYILSSWLLFKRRDR